MSADPTPSPTTDPPATDEGAAWGRQHLEQDVVGWLTTRAPDGRLQSSPISFLWEDGTVLFYSQPGTPKLRNIGATPQVAFHLQADPYADHALIIEGLARVDPDVLPSDRHEVYRAKYRDPLVHWGLEEAQAARDFSVPVRITPVRVRSW